MIDIDCFAEFVGEVHGPVTVAGKVLPRRPFPWQQALLHRVVEQGWPAAIDVPTGLGKTSVLDVALFAAALHPDQMPRRIFLVVDRRLVVDEAYVHAGRIRSALEQALAGDLAKPVSRLVAEALTVPGVEEPLAVTRMRGGVTWDRLWVQRPDQFAIVTGTVDQIGSRMLFRGYGLSEYGRSIDAALVGADSLIVVDEAHLAEAFHTTLAAAHSFDTAPLAPAPIVVAMSATNRDDVGDTHTITAADEQDQRVVTRLNAAKRLRLIEVKTTKKKATADVAAAMATLANRLGDRGVIGVVCNTVGRARAVFNVLAGGETEVVLLTGRSRPIGRDLLLARFYDRIKAGRDRTAARPLIVVATQTIEVGADIDLDAAVIESTAFPPLIQRLGRINRLGELTSDVPVYLVHDSTVDKDDPIYGAARLATWQWLTSLASASTVKKPDGPSVDVSPAALRVLRGQAPPAASQVPSSVVPVLFPDTLDEWVRTSPEPLPDTPVAPFLHGMNTEPAPVTVLWRTGLPAQHPQRWQAAVDAVPPAAEESLDLPYREALRWLLHEPATTPVADVDTTHDRTTTDRRRHDDQPLVLRYRGRGTSDVVPADQIRPGDTIVVPCEYGGCDEYGWNPDGTTTVADLADLARRRDRTLLRIGPHLHNLIPPQPEPIQALEALLAYAANDPDADRPTGYRPLLTTLADALDPQHPLRPVLAALTTRSLTISTIRQAAVGTGHGWQPTFVVLLSAQRAWHADEDSETATSASAYPGRRITLDNHERAVAARARQIATNLRLPAQVIDTIEHAARGHDEGKNEKRFQAMLFGGNRVAAEIAQVPLAKSGIDPTNRAEALRARQAARYPAGMRHEALSAAIAQQALTRGDLPPTIDPDLLVHLIASHHGRSRPLLPPVVDPHPTKITVRGLPPIDTADTVDWTAPARFAALNSRYGRWGLALCETVLRLADIWCSARDEEETHEPTP